jgi:hypothetical protein
MQSLIDYLNVFLHTDTPFMLLFITLFLYVIKTNREREVQDHGDMVNKLDKIDQELRVMIKVWKILLQKELEAKEDEQH